MKNRYQLREEYAKHGIDFVYNDRQRASYLKIKGAPLFVEGGSFPKDSGAPLTGWFRVEGGIKAVQDVDMLSHRAKELYAETFAHNSQMLKYLEACESPDYSELFIFDEELCVEDEKHECIDGYLWATEGLVSRLKNQVSTLLSSNILPSMEDMNFYVFYSGATGNIQIMGTFWYAAEDGSGERHSQVQVPINTAEAKALFSAMEAYCRKTYNMDCQAFLNEARAYSGLPAIKARTPDEPEKPALDTRIAAAETQRQNNTHSEGPSQGAPVR